MTGFATKQQELLQQVAPTYGAAQIAARGLSFPVDPLMSGTLRFAQRNGSPIAVMSSQIRASLAVRASPTQQSIALAETRLAPWLIENTVLALDGQDRVTVFSTQEQSDGSLLVSLSSAVQAQHEPGSLVYIHSWPIQLEATVDGQGSETSEPLVVHSPWILVPGDVVEFDNVPYELTETKKTGVSGGLHVYECRVSLSSGLPAFPGGETGAARAAPAYESKILSLPQQRSAATAGDPVLVGPFAYDCVNGPLVADYRPKTRTFIRTFNAAHIEINPQTEFTQNTVQSRVTVAADNIALWRVARGGINWDGKRVLMRAYDTAEGYAHLFSECVPALNPAPPLTLRAVVLPASPYNVILQPGFLTDTFTAYDVDARTYVASSLYTLDPVSGNVFFDSSLAGKLVVIDYRPRISWTFDATASVDGVELSVKLGDEPLQTFPLNAAGSQTSVTVNTTQASAIDVIHITARKIDGSVSTFEVAVGDWRPSGSQVRLVQYSLLTDAKRDYDWFAAGLQVKPLWLCLDYLRTRLDGDGALVDSLDGTSFLL